MCCFAFFNRTESVAGPDDVFMTHRFDRLTQNVPTNSCLFSLIGATGQNCNGLTLSALMCCFPSAVGSWWQNELSLTLNE